MAEPHVISALKAKQEEIKKRISALKKEIKAQRNEHLAKRASVALLTVRDFEKGRRTPISNNLEAIRRVIAEAGVELLFDETMSSNEGFGFTPWRQPAL